MSLPPSTLATWVKAYRAGRLGEVGKTQRPLTEIEMNLARTKKELVTFTVYHNGKPYQTRQRWDCKCKMEMIIRCPAGGGLKMPWAEKVEIGQISGRWATGDKTNSLWWQIKAAPDEESLVEMASFEIALRAGKNIPKEEMVKIAQSSLWENKEA